MEKLRQPIITVLGHVDHGKCVTPETTLTLADNRIVTAKQLYDEYASSGIAQPKDDYLVTEIKDGPDVFSLNGHTVEKARITHLWKIKSPKQLVRIKLRSGDEIETTFEHPFFVLNDKGEIINVKSEEIKEGDFIVVPQKLDFDSNVVKIKETIFNRLAKVDFVVFVDDECKLIERLRKENVYHLRAENVFSTDPSTCLANRRFRFKDYANLCKLFGFSVEESYNMIKSVKNSSPKWRAGHTSNKMKLPKTKEDFVKLGYVLGCMAGDGHVNNGILSNNDLSVQNNYQVYINEILGLETQVKQGHTCQIVRTNGGLTFVRFLIDIIGFPSSDKSATVEIPTVIYPDFETVAAFLRGWFDTDGYISHLNNTIEITSKSKKLVKQASVFLLGRGIHSAVFQKNGFWYLRIGNNPYLERFMIHIGSHCEPKKNRILQALGKASTSRVFDMTPIAGSVLGKIKLGNADNVIAYFTKYKTYRNLSRRFIAKIDKIPGTKEFNLNNLLSNEISFVRVVSKEFIVANNEFVYDFTVANTHNFVAERMFIHNTSLLDRIRQTAVASKEAGGITQAIGTTEIPASTIKEICGSLLQKFNIQLTIPGLLFIDTPGHEAFVTLRKRGGSIADLAIVIVDLLEGPMPQTIESIEILHQAKVPFVFAINKIDRLEGWLTGDYFIENYNMQSEEVKGLFEQKFYQTVEKLSTHGMIIERFDRISDFTKAVAAVPVSAKTGEGVAELLAILTGLAQQFLKQKLITTEESKGMILEVKGVTGLGTTVDVIIYDGIISKNDYLVIGGKIPRIAKIRALLVPEPMRDIRVEKKFRSIDECHAAMGVKISAPGLDDVVAGSPIRTAKTLEEAKTLLEQLEQEREEVEIKTEVEGLILKADTIGSLEALINIFQDHPIKEATIGKITKEDIIRAEANSDSMKRIVIGFNTKISEDIEKLSRDKHVKILESNIVYHLLEEYAAWTEKEKEEIKKKELDALIRPAKIRILPGCIFRASNPAIVGCEILGGTIKPGYKLMKNEKEVGEIKQIQNQGKNVDEAKIGDKVAISITGPTVGRQIDESDVLYTDVPSGDYKKMMQLAKFLPEHEKSIMEEILEAKRKKQPMYGY